MSLTAPSARGRSRSRSHSSPAATANGIDPAAAARAADAALLAALAEPTRIEVVSPADGRLVGEVGIDSPASVATVVADLRAAQPAWAALPVGERVRWMGRYRDWLFTHRAAIEDLIVAETGKPRAEVGFELSSSLAVLRYYSRHAAEFLEEETPGPTHLLTALKRTRVRYVPHEVVGVISPWNFPIAMCLWDAIPALLAGCSVVLKPSEQTPLATAFVAQGWAEIGAPAVLGVVHGTSSTGAAVVDHVDHVQFTGSTTTGRAVAERAARRLITCDLELGGNDAAVVLADADLDLAAAGIVFGGMLNAGQMCVSVERVYVESSVYEAFVHKVLDRVLALRSDGEGHNRDIGPLITPEQLALVDAHVSDAIAKGARAAVGGGPLPGQRYRPTVLVDVDHTMRVMTEETFGPVLPIMAVADVDEAVALANATEHGLSASVWSRDRRAAARVAERLEAGTVNINDAATHLLHHAAPQSGWKQSGIGSRMGGAEGIRRFTRTQSIVRNAVDLPLLTSLAGFPYSRSKSEVLAAVGRLVDGSGARQRLGLPLRSDEFTIRAERAIDAPPAQVLGWLLDSSNYARVLPGVGEDVLRPGEGTRYGVGTVRELRTALGTVREEILAVDAEGFDYRILSAPVPVQHLGARVRVVPVAGGRSCRVVWSSRFRGGVLHRAAADPAIGTVLTAILRGCARDLAGRPPAFAIVTPEG